MNHKKTFLLSCFLAAAVVVAAVAVYRSEERLGLYERHISASYQRSFAELASNIDDIDAGLQKCLYSAACEGVGPAAAEVFGKAMAAQMCLGELPLSDFELGDTASFISRVGDYSFSLAAACSRGAPPADGDYKNLLYLSGAARSLSRRLTEMQARVADGSLSPAELQSSQKSTEAAAPESFGGGFKQIESEFPEMPSLIYDGPFSQHLDGRSPGMTEGLAEVDEAEARRAAAQFLGADVSRVAILAERDGDLPAYLLSASAVNGEMTVTVTKRGGLVYSAFCQYAADGGGVDIEDALQFARDFLAERGFPAMRDSYWTVSGGTAIFNFAYEQDGVVCYPDLVKVAISLRDGSLIAYEGLGYIMNHRVRDIPEAAVSRAEAEQKLSPLLRVLSHSMAIIPSLGENEIFCHEFKCEGGDGRHYIVYVDAVTGLQSKLLILLEDENGTLTL